jgi:DNA-binding HxlR family transcriptional regulator
MSPRPRPGSPPRSGGAPSALVEAVERVGDRWTLLLVDVLLRGPHRFGELSEQVDGIAPNVLTARLRQLEEDGVVRATPYSRRPLRVEYELTDAGRELAGAVALLATWGRRRGGTATGLEHLTCGTALETRLWCPTCDVAVDDPGDDELEHL